MGTAKKTTAETLAFWQATKPINEVLPYTCKHFDYTLEEFISHCPTCGKDLTEVHGTVTEHPNCLEVRMVGICHPDRLLVNLPYFRQYADGRAEYYDNKEGGVGWTSCQVSNEDGFWKRLWNKIRGNKEERKVTRI